MEVPFGLRATEHGRRRGFAEREPSGGYAPCPISNNQTYLLRRSRTCQHRAPNLSCRLLDRLAYPGMKSLEVFRHPHPPKCQILESRWVCLRVRLRRCPPPRRHFLSPVLERSRILTSHTIQKVRRHLSRFEGEDAELPPSRACHRLIQSSVAARQRMPMKDEAVFS
jgi:hypothetical protein